MHLSNAVNSTQIIMANLVRQQTNRLLFSLQGQTRLATGCHQRNFTTDQKPPSFCAIYSSSKTSTWASLNNNRQQNYQTHRFANTSCGFYAPSKLASNQRVATSSARGNANVYEDSDHLPPLPVPSLDNTLELLKESISPVAMNSAEFVQTLELIDEFAKSAGPKLDLLLRTKASQLKNWMTHDWWTKQIYLRSRQPLVINSNPGMMYPIFPFEVNNQRSLISVVSQLISGVIDFKLSLMHGYNPEATNADQEHRLDPNICYHQYQGIFGSTRIPGEVFDQHKRSSSCDSMDNSSQSFNLVVSFRNKFFEINLKGIEDEKNRIEQLEGILNKIIVSVNENNDQEASATGAGVLTATNRNDWAKAYKLLDGDSIEAIQNAQFLICLDTIAPDAEDSPDGYKRALLSSPAGSEQHMAALGRQILHGDSRNIGNRWFDKCFQLIVVADENVERLLGAGINYEHSFGEGTIVTKMIEYSYDKTIQKHNDKSSSASSGNFFASQQVSSNEPATFRQLPMFNPEHEITKYLEQARQNFNSHLAQFDMSYMRYKHYGSNSIKSWHFSPDSWFQVALQMAYYDVHKRLGPCYETASTRRFAYGRTETIRSLTKGLASFCMDPKYETMQAAIQSHKSYAIAAANGNAIDRTLMGYRMTFNELKTNNWRWGLPTFDNLNSKSNREIIERVKEGSDPTPQQEQQVSIEDLFTEDELHTISSLFNSELINRSSRFALSTSQVPSIHPNITMSYGPLLADGYGCCYNITGQQIVAAITANSSNQSFSCEVEKLNESLQNSLSKMRDIVEEHRSSKSN